MVIKQVECRCQSLCQLTNTFAYFCQFALHRRLTAKLIRQSFETLSNQFFMEFYSKFLCIYAKKYQFMIRITQVRVICYKSNVDNVDERMLIDLSEYGNIDLLSVLTVCNRYARQLYFSSTIRLYCLPKALQQYTCTPLPALHS